MWKSGYRAALLSMSLSACSFPEVSVQQTSSGSIASSSLSTSGQGPGGGEAGTTGGTGGAGGVGGSGVASGAGGANETGGAGGTSGDPCTPGDCSETLDKDNDGHADAKCAADGGGGGGLPQDDCDDCDNRVFPGQMVYFGEPQPTVGFDYDCDGREERRYPSSVCTGLLLCGVSNIFLSGSPVACGVTNQFGDCAIIIAAVCDFVRDTDRQQTCH